MKPDGVGQDRRKRRMRALDGAKRNPDSSGLAGREGPAATAQEARMADTTRTLTIRQTVRRPQYEIVRRQWSAILERTITREIAADGSIVAEEVSEEIVEPRADFGEERLEAVAEDDEVIAESVSDGA
jgi:hypothetical protein